MRSWIVRMVCGAVVVCGGVIGEAEACTHGVASVTVGQATIATSVFVPTIVSAATPLSIAAPVTTHIGGFGVVTVPQAVVVPQATVQQLLVPQILQQQVIRQQIRTTVVPRLGIRSLICR